MDGKLYYSYKAPKQSVRFFALESGYMDPPELQLTSELKSSSEDWKIAYFHHPLYSSGLTHGSDLELRTARGYFRRHADLQRHLAQRSGGRFGDGHSPQGGEVITVACR